MDQIADGICDLEDILGVSLREMRTRHRIKVLEEIEKARTEKEGGGQ